MVLVCLLSKVSVLVRIIFQQKGLKPRSWLWGSLSKDLFEGTQNKPAWAIDFKIVGELDCDKYTGIVRAKKGCLVMEKIELLRDIPLFKDFSEEELMLIADVSFFKQYEADTTIFLENMPGEALYIVKSGAVKISKMISEGQQKTLAISRQW